MRFSFADMNMHASSHGEDRLHAFVSLVCMYACVALCTSVRSFRVLYRKATIFREWLQNFVQRVAHKRRGVLLRMLQDPRAQFEEPLDRHHRFVRLLCVDHCV